MNRNNLYEKARHVIEFNRKFKRLLFLSCTYVLLTEFSSDAKDD